MRAIAIFVCGVLVALGVQAIAEIGKSPLDMQCALEHNLFDTSHAVDALHKLKIGKSAVLQDSLEEEVLLNAKMLSRALDDKTIDTPYRNRVNAVLQLISVMNEKFIIEQWRSDQNLQTLLEMAQREDKLQVAKLRCFDWSQPMWTGKPLCSP